MEIFNQGISKVFGDNGQTAFARFLVLLGDTREMPTIRRSVSNWARGANRVPPEVMALLTFIQDPAKAYRLIEQSKNAE